jgi:diketogulonate reductase-like aldo/keto reductase
MDHVDCFLVHSPTPLKYDEKSNFPRRADGQVLFDLNINIFTETWPAIEEVVRAGLLSQLVSPTSILVKFERS